MSKLLNNNSIYYSVRGLIDDLVYSSIDDTIWDLIIKIKDNTK